MRRAGSRKTLRDFLPDLDEARAERSLAPQWDYDGRDLSRVAPAHVEPQAALIIRWRGVERSTSTDQIEVPENRARIGEMPEYPKRFVEWRTTRVVTDILEDVATPCSLCVGTPGLSRCPRCDGTGKLRGPLGGRILGPPCDCERGWVVCEVCEGSRLTRWVMEATVEDRSSRIRAHHIDIRRGPLRNALVKIMSPSRLPEALRWTPTGERRTGPYRGGPREADGLHGHDFGAARAAARKTARALAERPSLVQRAELYAWPFLRVDFHFDDARNRHVYLVRDEELRHRVVS